MRRIVLFLTMFLCFLGAKNVTAQNESDVPKAEFEGAGEDLDAMFKDGNEEKMLYLYNVGKDMFLNAGGYWGTQLMTYTVGLPITITKVVDSKGTYYKIMGPFDNSEYGTGHYVGRVVNTNDKTKDGVFWDRTDDKEACWTFEKIENADNENKYRISVNGTYLTGNVRMLEDLLYTANYNAVGYDANIPTGEDAAYAEWKIVMEKDLTEDFKKTYNKTKPSEATFLIRAQNFNRQNVYNEVDDATKEGWHKSGNFTYDYTVGLTNTMDGNGRSNATHGMFFNAGIAKANKDDKLYQTLTMPKAGWYRLDCEGLFYNSANEDDCNVVMYATVEGAEADENSSQNSYMDLLPKKQQETAAKLDDRREAGMAFYYGYYPNSLLVYVPEDNKKMEIGIRVTKDMAADDYAWFDDFELRYLGQEMYLDEGDEQFDTEDNTGYVNRVLVLKRTLTKDKWNTLILPVSLTKQQLFTAFFPNPMIAELKGFEDNHTIGFQIMDLSSKGENDIALEAGKCYIIKPDYEGKDGSYTVLTGQGRSKVITAPYYVIDRVSLNKSTVTEVSRITSGDSFSGSETTGTFTTDCSIAFYGCYQKTPVAANAYVFSKGDMYHLPQNGYTTKGFSCWLEDAHQMNDGKRHAISFSMNGVNDGTTAIEGIYVNGDEAGIAANENVYNLSGQVVCSGNTSLEGLPKGVYVVNGKKYVVK